MLKHKDRMVRKHLVGVRGLYISLCASHLCVSVLLHNYRIKIST